VLMVDTNFQQKQLKYIECVKLGCSIMICNYAALNMAIDLGFDKQS
jgi:hypothetical protein